MSSMPTITAFKSLTLPSHSTGIARRNFRVKSSMNDDPNPYVSPSSPIEHTNPSRRMSRPIGLFVYLVGWSWPLVLGLSGVAADRVRIPTLMKVALSFVSFLLPVFVTPHGGRWRWGCASFLGAYCLLAIMVMWFWN